MVTSYLNANRSSPEAVDDEMLLSLASALKQSLQSWRAQLAQAADRVEQLRRLRAERMDVETRMVDTRGRFQKEKGWRVLQKVVEGAGSAAMDSESARLCERARELLSVRQQQLERALAPYKSELERLHAEIEAVEQQPAVQAYLAEQTRLAEQARLAQEFTDVQARYGAAHTVSELEIVQATVFDLVAQVNGDGVLSERAEQLRAMIESDLAQARAREAEVAERRSRERFGRWIHALSKKRSSSDLVLTFGVGQAIHLSVTGQTSAKGHPRVMLVSAVGFELPEPTVRTLLPDKSRARYYQLEPAAGLPARGWGRAFDWQYGRRRPANHPTQEGQETEVSH